MTGAIDLEPDSFIREETAKSKAKKHMFRYSLLLRKSPAACVVSILGDSLTLLAGARYAASVGTSKRVFMMFAETDQEQRAWIAALKRALDGLRSGNSDAAVSTSPSNGAAASGKLFVHLDRRYIAV